MGMKDDIDEEISDVESHPYEDSIGKIGQVSRSISELEDDDDDERGMPQPLSIPLSLHIFPFDDDPG